MNRKHVPILALATVLGLALIAGLLAWPDQCALLGSLSGGGCGVFAANSFMAAFIEGNGELSEEDPAGFVKGLLTAQGKDLAEFKSNHLSKLDGLVHRVDDLQLKLNRSRAMGNADQQRAAHASLDESERKALAAGVRAFLSGDQDATYKHLLEGKAMSAGNDPSGGYLVVPELSPQVERVMLETSPLLDEIRVIDLGATDEWEEIIDNEEAQAIWAAETEQRSDTQSPGVKKFTAPTHEIYAQPKVTQKLIDSTSFDVVAWLGEKIGEKFGNSFGAAVVGGNGIGKPFGFLSSPTASAGDATRPWGKLQHIPTGASAGFASSNPTDVFDDTVATLKTQYRKGAKWAMSRTAAAAIGKMKDSTGQRLWQPSMVAGQPPMLLGYPVIEDDNMPAISADSTSIAFGNFKRGYVMTRRLGIRFLTDPYTAKPFVRLYAYQRVGGGVLNTEAIKLIKFGTS